MISMLTEFRSKVSPSKTKNTPDIIGFLQYLYGPRIISLCVGVQGASVPFPKAQNRYTDQKNKTIPEIRKTRPSTLKTTLSGKRV